MGEGGQRYKLTAITSADVEKKKKVTLRGKK